MGKDFTSAKGDDNVFTPYSMTEQFLELENFHRHWQILEPACGEMEAIINILDKNKFFNLTWYDIQESENLDFIYEDQKYDAIITNPPYSQLNKFIAKAKQIAKIKFAFLCKITHLGSVKRFNEKIFFDPEYPLTKIYMFVRQANLRFNTKYNPEYKELREDGKYPAGMYYYCWLVWEKQENIWVQNDINNGFNNIQFDWIDNNQYILQAGDQK